MSAIALLNAPSPSPAIDQAVGYAALVTDGIRAREAMDTGRWILGGNVRQLVTHYREHTVEQYADDVGGVEATSLYEYAGVASFYTADALESLSELDLCYSHYREARRLKTLDKAVEFLKLIALNHWTTHQTRAALKEIKRNGGDIAATYSSSSPITGLDNRVVNRHPVYQWRGPATVSIDEKGVVRLVCEGLPEIEQGARYMVSFEEY